MSSEDPRERADLCGQALVAESAWEDLAEQYDPETWYEAADGTDYCRREAWDGADDGRCIWHADVADKPVDALSAARSEEPARLDWAVLRECDLRDGVALSECRFVDADLGGADLRSADLGEADLGSADLGEADLVDADLRGADLGGANLGEAVLVDADLRGASLPGANLDGAGLVSADLGGAYLRRTDLRGADLVDADLRGADLRRADLGGADLMYARLVGADLLYAKFVGTDLEGADLGGAFLVSAVLGEANLSDADLGEANLSDADLGGADLRDSRLADATLQGAALTDADLERADCTRANLFDADLTGAALYGAVLANVQLNIDTTFGAHYIADGAAADPVKAAWTLRQLQRLFRENALPGRARAAYLDRKDRRRRQYWADALAAPWTDGSATDRLRTMIDRLGQWARTALYGVTMRYGESPLRVVTLSVLTVFAFGVVYPFFGGIDAGGDASQHYGFEPVVASVDGLPGPVVDVLANLYFSAVTFTTLGYGDIQPATPVVELLATVESFVGALLMALLVFVLGRRATW